MLSPAHPAIESAFLKAVKKKNSGSKSSPAPLIFSFLREKDFFYVPDVPNVPLHPFGRSANKQSPTGEQPAAKNNLLEAVKKKNSDRKSSPAPLNFSFLREKDFFHVPDVPNVPLHPFGDRCRQTDLNNKSRLLALRLNDANGFENRQHTVIFLFGNALLISFMHLLIEPCSVFMFELLVNEIADISQLGNSTNMV